MTDSKKNRFAKVAENLTQMRAEPEPSVIQAVPAPRPKMGRPPGKSSNPDYVQVTVYLRRNIHQSAKKLLIDQSREFSELVDDLVSRWVKNPEV